MFITLFGSCRLNNLHYLNNLNNITNYTHSTKEVIQLIKFLKGEMNFPIPYNRLCFRSAILNNNYVEYNEIYNTIFANTNIFVIEICSIKKYMHNGYYMHHLPFDKLWHKFDNYQNRHFIDKIFHKKY
jgi:hypothetical protein